MAPVILAKLSPAIISIRLERLIERIQDGEMESSIRLCKVYSEDMEKTYISIMEREEAIKIADDLFQVELLLMLNVTSNALEMVKNLQEMIRIKLINYEIVRKRMLNTEFQNEEKLGALCQLPMDVLRDIADRVHQEYCW